jgi:sporulation protein YlmC with PRC-barrel domain
VERINRKLLVIPGYLIGIGCLFLITQRTILAFFNENKAVTIYINRYGEQYADIVSLVVLWLICVGGLFLLLRLKEEETLEKKSKGMYGKTVVDEQGVYLGILQDTVVNKKTGTLASILVEPSKDLVSYSEHRDDQGNLVFSQDSIKSVEDIVVIKR